MAPGPSRPMLDVTVKRLRSLLGGAAILVALAATPTASASSLTDLGGAPLANTETAACPEGTGFCPQANISGGLGHVMTPLGEPFSAARPEGVGPSGAPDDDLEAALARMGDAPDADAFEDARREALAILEGTTSDGRPYDGMGLLNWRAGTKVQEVGADDTVTVREVRFGEHALTDTDGLRFKDPAKPFSIHWVITELGTSMGGELAPASLLDRTARRCAARSPPSPRSRSR